MLLDIIKAKIHQVSSKQDLDKSLTAIIIMALIASPSMWGLVAFLDILGIELLFLCLRAQLADNILFIYKTFLYPVLKHFYALLTRIDPIFFVPSLSVTARYPYLLMHAIPMHLCFVMIGVNESRVEKKEHHS